MSDTEPRSGGLTVQQGASLGAGMMCVSGAAMAYRAKKTLPFKLAYFLSWPVLGTAILTTFSPDKRAMEQVSRRVDGGRRRCAELPWELQLAAVPPDMPFFLRRN